MPATYLAFKTESTTMPCLEKILTYLFNPQTIAEGCRDTQAIWKHCHGTSKNDGNDTIAVNVSIRWKNEMDVVHAHDSNEKHWTMTSLSQEAAQARLMSLHVPAMKQNQSSRYARQESTRDGPKAEKFILEAF
jgi:hypothetical protein